MAAQPVLQPAEGPPQDLGELSDSGVLADGGISIGHATAIRVKIQVHPSAKSSAARQVKRSL